MHRPGAEQRDPDPGNRLWPRSPTAHLTCDVVPRLSSVHHVALGFGFRGEVIWKGFTILVRKEEKGKVPTEKKMLTLASQEMLVSQMWRRCAHLFSQALVVHQRSRNGQPCAADTSKAPEPGKRSSAVMGTPRISVQFNTE